MPADVAVSPELHSAMSRRWQHRGSAELLSADMRLIAGTVLMTAMPVAGLVVASRRATGGVTAALSASGMTATVMSLLACVLACDWLLRARRRQLSSLLAHLLPRLGLWACLWGVSGGEISRGVALISLGGAAAGLVPWTRWHRDSLLRLRRTVHRIGPDDIASATQPPSSETKGPASLAVTPPLEVFTEGDGFLQQQTRRRTTAGGECIKGTVLVSFRVGERVAVAHVGFCPPFQETPTVQLSTAYDEMDASVAPGEILPWGLRVECKLEEAAEEPFDIPIDFVATAAATPPSLAPAFLPDPSTT
jgi:hypothetical protein